MLSLAKFISRNRTEQPKEKYRFGISLSGGGARGILHLGVLEALRNHGIHPEIVSGTSIGAFIGVMFSAGMAPLDILELVKSSKMYKMIKWKVPSSGLLDMRKIKDVLEKYIPEDDFSALKIPFCCAVTNLNSGMSEMKNSGKLFQWVLASASIPLIFEPQIINGQTYVDGGLLNNLPAKGIRDQCRLLIGVNVNHNGPEDNIKGFKAIAERAFRLTMAKNVHESFAICDFIINPAETRPYSIFDFGKADDLFNLGFIETNRRMPELFEIIATRNILIEK
jgi:NTE family protein